MIVLGLRYIGLMIRNSSWRRNYKRLATLLKKLGKKRRTLCCNTYLVSNLDIWYVYRLRRSRGSSSDWLLGIFSAILFLLTSTGNVAIVLKNPTDAQAYSHTRYIHHLIEFSTRVQNVKVLKIQLLLDLCSEFERLALHTISKAAKDTGISTPPSVSIASGFKDMGRQAKIQSR